jgi:hypothetical protein
VNTHKSIAKLRDNVEICDDVLNKLLKISEQGGLIIKTPSYLFTDLKGLILSCQVLSEDYFCLSPELEIDKIDAISSTLDLIEKELLFWSLKNNLSELAFRLTETIFQAKSAN